MLKLNQNMPPLGLRWIYQQKAKSEALFKIEILFKKHISMRIMLKICLKNLKIILFFNKMEVYKVLVNRIEPKATFHQILTKKMQPLKIWNKN